MQQYDEFSGSLELRDDDNKHIRKHFVKILTDNRNGKKIQTLSILIAWVVLHILIICTILWKNYVKKCQLSN